MASATMTVHVRLRRVWPTLWWLRLAAQLARFGLGRERAVAIGNRLLGLARVDFRDDGGRRLGPPKPFPGRMVVTDDDRIGGLDDDYDNIGWEQG